MCKLQRIWSAVYTAPGACNLKILRWQLLPFHNKLEGLPIIVFHPSLIFAGKAGAYKALMGFHSNGRLQDLSTNVRIGWK